MSDPQLSRLIAENPAAQARPRYPRPYQSEATKALSDEEMNALLAVVRRLAEGGSVVGKRDYALLLFYFLTGLRRSEVIGLQGQRPRAKGNPRHQVPAQGWEVHRQRSRRPFGGRGAQRLSRGFGADRMFSGRSAPSGRDTTGRGPGAPLTSRASSRT